MSAIETVLELLGFVAKHEPEVAEFFGKLVNGDTKTLDRVASILPAKSEAARVAELLDRESRR